MWRRRFLSPSFRLIAAALAMDMAAGGAMLLLQFTGVALGVAPALLGALSAVSSATYTASCLISGWLGDRLGARHSTRLAMLLLVVTWSAMAGTRSLAALMGLAVAAGIGMSLFWPAMMVWVAALSSGQARGLGRRLGLFNISWSVGLLLGAVLAGVLWDRAGRGSFYYSVAVGLLILVLLQCTPGAMRSPSDQPPPAPSVGDERQRAAGRRLLMAARFGLFASFFATGTIRALFPKIGDQLGYSGAIVGWGAGAPYLSAMLIFALSGSTSRWHYRASTLWLAIPTGVVAMGLASAAHTPAQFLTSFVLVGFCTGICYLASQFYGLHVQPESRGRNMGYNEAILGAGMVLGPLLGGLTAQQTEHLPAAFVLAAAVLALAGLAQLAWWWQSRAGRGSVASVAGEGEACPRP